MKHGFIDTYAHLNSPLHRLPVKVKLILTFAFLLLIALSPRQLWLVSLYAGTVFLLACISRVPFKFILTRIIEALPAILFLSGLSLFQKNGCAVFLVYLVKALAAVTLMIILTSSTPFSELLNGLRLMGMPSLIILLLSFMYRYVFLLEDEFLRTKRAYQLRANPRINKFTQVRVLSNIVGVLFIRTYERAERVYLAMCARGFNGEEGN
jgi:cobalt/nickel transport system permease protein